MNAFLEQQGLDAALEELPAATIAAYDYVIRKKSFSALILCLVDRVLRKKLYTFQMHPGQSQSEHINEFYKLVGDLAAIDTAISDKDQALLLLTSLISAYDNFMETLLYGRDTLKLEDVVATLYSRELQKMTKAKGNGGERLYVRGRSGRRDMKQDTFAVVDKIYAHESLTFNNTIVCDVISKWKDGLKDDIDARSDVYALSNSYRKCSVDNDDYYWEYTQDFLDKAKGNVLGIKIVRDQSGNTLRVSQSRFYSGKLVKTLLEGHSILSLEGYLSGNYVVDKNASEDLGMLDKVDCGLQTDVQVFVDFDYAMGRLITVIESSITRGCNEAYLANGTCNRVKIQAKDNIGYCYRCLVKGYA
nr:zinc finger, CCHC-type [Tanacetum cinerariifolium]